MQETIARIDECGSWVLLKYIEQDPAYAGLMRDVLAQIEDIVKPKTGEMIRFEGFIFISSPTQSHHCTSIPSTTSFFRRADRRR